MKIIYFLFILFFTTNASFANKIDRLITTEDVEEFVKDIEPMFTKYQYSIYNIIPTDSLKNILKCHGIFEKWKVKNWEKTDINNDGKTDLLFIISNKHDDSYPYIIVDEGLRGYKSINLALDYSENCQLFKPLLIGKKNYLNSFIIKRDYKGPMDYEERITIDTLTYKFDEIIEHQKNPTKYGIKSIEYRTGCSDGCPIFSIKINSDRTANYNGQLFTKVNGERRIKISSKKFKELENLLGYIRVKELNEEYSVPWLHGKTGYLIITFIDNTQKIIDDYGSIGSYGLSATYKKIEDIVKTQIWD